MFLEKASSKVICYRVKEDGAIFHETPDNMVKKNLIDFFSEQDKSEIIAYSSLNPISLKHGRESLIFMVLVSLFLTTLFIAIPLSPNLVNVFGYNQPGGILIFPLSFFLLDAINEVYGRKHARNLILIGALSLLFASFSISLSLNLTPINPAKGEHYTFVFSNLPHLLIINAVCLFFADSVNNIIYSKMKLFFHGGFLLLRCLVSIVFGQFLYSAIWIFLFFGTELGWVGGLNYVLSNYYFKLIYSLFVCIPLTYFTVISIRYYYFNRAATT